MKEETTYSSSTEDLNKKGTNDTILKRIPIGAEATTVLVGSVDFLEQPTIAFVRLAEGALMPAITEVRLLKKCFSGLTHCTINVMYSLISFFYF